jgi:hypothetical protein
MPWHASLQLDYALEQGRSVARHKHSGPLRILQSWQSFKIIAAVSISQYLNSFILTS